MEERQAHDGVTGRPTPDEAAATAVVLIAVWCRSVGVLRTLELTTSAMPWRLDVVDWISSAVPISQAEPDGLACELLAE